MPMIDLYVPEGALSPEAERDLAERITTLMLKAEGAWPADEDVLAGSWALVHHAQVYAGGAPAAEPRYRVDAFAPQGLISDPEVRERLVADITEAVLDAEGPDRPRDPSRVFVFPLEIPERRWGWGGRLIGLEDVLTIVTGDAEQARETTRERLAGQGR
ncbi:tautomerase family protein [Streptomyces sp. R-07]|uniref:tautomerase family protein n=1 Tax=Streptomyces sp. R-07 TaxID=3404052 RepID=UPI003CE898ED